MEPVKSMPLGSILTYGVALLTGSQGRTGGHLNIFPATIEKYELWWSWPLFLAGTGRSSALMVMQRYIASGPDK